MTDDARPIPAPADVQQAMAYYDSWLGFRQRYLRVPGVQAAVRVGDEVVMSQAYGHADVERGEPLTTSTLFRIASHSKTFTATAVFQLMEAATLRLDDPARDWVPELADASPLSDVTIRELLTHSGGVVRDSADGDFWQLWRPFPDRDELRAIVCSDDASVLGRFERFKYSNIGYGLLGLILEAAGGVSYDELLRRSVLEPLGLADTGTECDPLRAGEYAVGYSALAYAEKRVPIEHVDTRALAAATGFYSTAADLVTYFSAHFTGDDRLLGDQAKRHMQHPVREAGKASRRYAHGLAVVPVGERTMIGHGGGYPGHITTSVADPHGRVAVSILTNAIDGPSEPLAHAGVRLLDLAASNDADTSDADLTRFTGRFASLWGVADVAVLGGRLHLVNPAQPDPAEDVTRLEVADDTTLRVIETSGYASYGEYIRYEFADDGSIDSVRGPSATTLTPLERFELPERVRT